MNNKSASSGGFGLSGSVFLIFLTLKLTGHIAWSWWLVTAPLWIPIALVVAVVIVAVPIIIVAEKIAVRRSRRRNAEIIERSKKR